MKLAVIASDQCVFSIIEAERECSCTEITAIWTPDVSLQEKIVQNKNYPPLVSDWTEILRDSSIEAVVVAGSDPAIVTAAGQLLQTGQRLVISTLAADPTSIFAYTALWQDAPDRVHPLFFSGVTSIVRGMLTQLSEADLGQLWRMEFSRKVANERHRQSAVPRLSKSLINSLLFQDLSWIRMIEQDSRQITMLVTEQGDAQFPVEAHVKLAGEGEVELNWHLTAANSDSWQLQFICEHGELQLECDTDGRLQLNTGVKSSSPLEERRQINDDTLVNQPSPRPSPRAIKSIESGAQHKNLDFSNARASVVDDLVDQLLAIANSESDAGWYQVIQLGEIGAAAERSLQRRRTIPIQFEDASERSQFKSQMTAIGCGALLWAMFGTIGMLIIGSALDPRDRAYVTSASAGYVLRNEDFTKDSEQFAETGISRLQEIARTWSSTSPVLLLESDIQGREDLDKLREANVLFELQERDINNAEPRLIVRTFPGQAFEMLLLIGWTIVFLPIAIFLGAQLLIVVARPSE